MANSTTAILNGWVNTVLQYWFSATDLNQRGFAALVIKLLGPVEAVPAKSHDLAGLGDAVELFCKPRPAFLLPIQQEYQNVRLSLD